MTARRTLLGLALVLATALGVAIPRAGGAPAEPYEINAILPLTGQAAFLGTASATTLSTVEAMVNRSGGIQGRPIKFVVQDDQSNPQLSVQLLNGLIAKNAPVVLGSELSSSCGAAIPLLKNGPVMYCFSPGVHPSPGSFAFSAGLSTADMLQAIAHYFRVRGWHKVAIITSTDATGQDAERNIDAAFATEGTVTVTDREHFNVSDISVAAQMTHIRNSGADAVIAWAAGTPFGTLMRGAYDAGVKAPIATSNANLIYTQLEQLRAYLPANLYFAGIPSNVTAEQLPRSATKAAQVAYVGAFSASGVRPDVGEYQGWDATWIVVDALKKLGLGTTAPQLRDAIANLRGWVGVNGPYDFRAFPQRGIGTPAVSIVRWEPSRNVWVEAGR